MTSGDRASAAAARRAPRWYVILVLLAAGSAWLYLSEPPKTPAVWQGSTMGTTYTVKLATSLSDDEHRRIGRILQDELTSMNQAMSTWVPQSDVSRFSRAKANEAVTMSARTIDVLKIALQVSKASGGAFDITVGPLVDAWGFGPKGRPEALPDEAALAALRSRVGLDKLSLQKNTLTKSVDGVAIDLSGVAKGYAVDQLAKQLEREGHNDYLVEIGGETRVRGTNPKGQPWRVAVRRPLGGAVAVNPGSRAVATSGNDRNVYERDSKKYAHTIDPRLGRPVEHDLLGASVIHDATSVADAWATALMVLGQDDAWAIAEAKGLAVALFVAEEGKVVTRMTAGFRAHLTEGAEDAEAVRAKR